MTDLTVTTIRPFLTVNNGQNAVDFYISAFGAIEKTRFEMPDNKLSSVLEIEKAIKLGATEICPMTTEEDWRIGKLKDPFGHIWEIGYTL
ncbi:VOC family protein [Adhaeribacter pallidiroseus]|uniref:VOC domain-containing protein n=1 Tax=Adhaeribacter pallidiroseus TaxID=2072847 RepID=A0A369QGY3_9BACT|nr:hypothetical protein [Adhaeribacter pallidiroseus]RDC62486.1 hypothetical protein AHMF7616_01080 [Adhaeribacter pallidiroseus]